MDAWSMVAEERARLVEDLALLRPEAWDQPSLVPLWNVRQVVAHLVATAEMSPPKFVVNFVKNRFSFARMTESVIDKKLSDKSDKELVGRLGTLVNSTTAPPGPTTGWLGETIVHGEDVFRAVDTYREHPADHLIAIADFYSHSNALIHAKTRIAGIRLRGTDVEWNTGDGPEVEGPLIAIVMAMCGRKTALEDLKGEAVDVLRQRD